MRKEKPVKIWCPQAFRSHLYKKKAKNPDDTLQDIMNNMVKEDEAKERKSKNEKFPYW